MFITISERDTRPIYLQIVTGIKEQIRRGVMHPGMELPSVRELADHLGINLHTVHHAYRQLRDEGIIHLRLGQRARIAALRERPAGDEVVEARLAARLHELVTEAFHLGLSRQDFRQLVEDELEVRHTGGELR